MRPQGAYSVHDLPGHRGANLASALFELALWVFFQPRPQPAEVFGRILLMLVASTVFTGFMVTFSNEANASVKKRSYPDAWPGEPWRLKKKNAAGWPVNCTTG